jgi:hypothetical protein
MPVKPPTNQFYQVRAQKAVIASLILTKVSVQWQIWKDYTER